MTNAFRLMLLSAVFPLITASQADACWRCWKNHHSSHYVATQGGGGGGAGASDLTPSTEAAARPEAGLTPNRTSPPADGAADTQTPQPQPSEIGTKLDKMAAQLDRIEGKLGSSESAAAPSPESAIAAMAMKRVGAKMLDNLLQDFENRLTGAAAAPALEPAPEPADQNAAAKQAFIDLLTDPDVKAALKEAVK